MVVGCAVSGCLNTYTLASRDNRKFFRFPRDEVRCRQWIQKIGRPDLLNKDYEILNNSYRVCDVHFESSYRLVKRLTQQAIPTLALPQIDVPDGCTKWTQTEPAITGLNPEELIREKTTTTPESSFNQITSSVALQTPKSMSENSSLKRKLLTDLKTETKKVKVLESQLNFSKIANDNFDTLSPKLQKLINLQNKLKQNSHGNRYDKEFKNFSLNLYLANPLAYTTLQKIISLPSIRTLRRIDVEIGTTFDYNILSRLKSKLQKLQTFDKYCIICANEMILKRNLCYQINKDKIIGFQDINGIQVTEPATRAFVLLARGIYSEWSQPLGYCFLAESKMSEELNSWIIHVLTTLIDTGFKIVAFVSDDKPIFSSLAESLQVSITKPYFDIDDHKIYYIFDVPYLVKSLRNSLVKYDFSYNFDGTTYTASWDDIKTFYEHDIQRQYRLAPKLTDSHIDPNNSEQMELKYATQVLSRTVTAAMSCCMELGQLNYKSIGTMKLIELLNDTFDILNSAPSNDPNIYKEPLSAKEHQKEKLDQFSYFLSNVTVHNKNNTNINYKMSFLESFKITLKSIEDLAKDLKANDLRHLFTRRLNQDSVHNFFESVRQQRGNCKQPTAIQFSRVFRKLFVGDILECSNIDNTNCSDILEQLVNVDDFENVLKPEVEDNIQTLDTSLPIQIESTDYHIEVTSQNGFDYICEYILKRCNEKHKCNFLNLYMLSIQTIENGQAKIETPIPFQDLIKDMDEKFLSVFNNNNIHERIGKEILEKINEINFEIMPCPCFPVDYFKKLFILLRIFNVLHQNNSRFKSKSCKDKTFKVYKLSWK